MKKLIHLKEIDMLLAYNIMNRRVSKAREKISKYEEELYQARNEFFDVLEKKLGSVGYGKLHIKDGFIYKEL